MKLSVNFVFLVILCTCGSFYVNAQHLSSFSDAFAENSNHFDSEVQKNLHADLISGIMPTGYFLDGTFSMPANDEVEKVIVDLQSAELLSNPNLLLNKVKILVLYVSDFNQVSVDNSIDISNFPSLMHVKLILQSEGVVDTSLVSELFTGASPDLYITYATETPN